eukprot:GHVH01002954.1.p1 GENE.GHVH01002954.1~~GHVH01002954.1.p1  ORF type:complete len:300 (+),score=49.67 GHVH01002954.1:333-1232(+)
MVRKHSKNITAGSVFTHFERRNANSELTRSGRFGGHSTRQFEQCWLCLKEAENPVMTPQGILYCKECIVLNLGEQKKEQQRVEVLEYLDDVNAMTAITNAQHVKVDDDLAQFKALEDNAVYKRGGALEASAELALEKRTREPDTIYSNKEEKRKACFWLGENAPSHVKSDAMIVAEKNKVKEEKRRLTCPVSGKPIKLKSLVPLSPDVIWDGVGDSTKTARWLCHVSRKKITCQPAVVVLRTGVVVLQSVCEAVLIGHRGTLPGGEVLQWADVRVIHPGGSGYSRHNKVETSIDAPLMG